MRLDPFRIQILTLSIDSQTVLTLVGLIVAGLLVQRAAREQGLDLGAGDWWDLVLAAVVGARLVWVLTHAEYFLRQPLQVLVIVDGGLSAIGLALGAIVGLWRFSRTGDSPPWRTVADLVAIGVLTTYLFERVGCALTTCGAGPTSDLPWAILRGDTWHAPLALAQVVVLAVALMLSAETLRARGAPCFVMLIAAVLVEAIAASAGRASAESATALGLVAVSYASSAWYTRSAAATDSGAPGSGGAHPGDGALTR